MKTNSTQALIEIYYAIVKLIFRYIITLGEFSTLIALIVLCVICYFIMIFDNYLFHHISHLSLLHCTFSFNTMGLSSVRNVPSSAYLINVAASEILQQI